MKILNVLIIRYFRRVKNKVLIFIIILLITPIICGIYGVLHDQFTYTISPEYFTKFKFIQFQTAEAIPNRLAVSIVGFKATWWVGIPLGIVLALIGLIHADWREMLNVYLKSLVRIIPVVFLVGLIGLFWGWGFHKESDLHWFFPENLVDTKNFMMVGSMHNFSYIGGAIGLFVGVTYQFLAKK